MTKRGDILNQFAIICDLIEGANITTVSSTVLLILDDDEFERIFSLIENKSRNKPKIVKNKFSITIGDVDIIFNRNSV